MEAKEDLRENKRGLIANSLSKAKTNIFIYLLKKGLLFSSGSREFLLKKFDKKLHEEIVEKDTTHTKAMQQKKYDFLMSMLTCTKRNIDKGWISKEVIERAINTLVKFGFVGQDSVKKIQDKFKEKYGILPPTFILFSPTQKCNLNCVGCYASAKANAPTLSFETVDRICDEVYNEWGSRFMTISGGEPLMYKDNGKTLFDIWKKYSDMFFLFYTNGTMVTKEVAKKLADLGNVTPAISIEGWEKETDERRGNGVFKKIVEASNNLKESGTPFGFSITATAKNIDTLLDDKFYDYLFLELGASYIWMFQLMPIGQARDLKELMLNPEQRIKLFRKWEHLLSNKRYCIADFWNSGVLADGCIAYGRSGGYLYVDWNGNITPCGFVPFYEDNILDLHKKGKKLADALFSDLFVNGRKWQDKYGLSCTKSPENWLMPCSIRDNWKNFKKNILSKNSKPQDEYAKVLVDSKEYDKFLTEFDKKLEKVTKPIWKKEYLEEKEEKKKKK